MEFRKVGTGRKRRTAPIKERKARRHREKHLTQREMKERSYAGIRHPGSLTKYGYHINGSTRQRETALDKATKRYGRKSVLQKLSDLYRLDYNKPDLRENIIQDIRYVSKGKRSD